MVRQGSARYGLAAAAALMTVTTLACNQLVLRTARAPVEACDAALTGGRLVTSSETGLGLQAPDAPTVAVTWPFGYRAGGIVGSVELQDESGRVLAREGDFVEVGGGFRGDGSFLACAGTVRVVPAPT